MGVPCRVIPSGMGDDVAKCYQAGWDWCPGGGLLERKRANGRGAAEDLTREYRRDREKLSLVQIKEHNDEIARASSRGFHKLHELNRRKGLAAERVAYERESRRQPPSWQKWWLKPVTTAIPSTTAVPETRTVVELCSHGSRSTPVDFLHHTAHDEFSAAYDVYDKAVKMRNVAWATLLKEEQGYSVHYGFSSVLPKLLDYKHATVPKSYRPPVRKGR